MAIQYPRPASHGEDRGLQREQAARHLGFHSFKEYVDRRYWTEDRLIGALAAEAGLTIGSVRDGMYSAGIRLAAERDRRRPTSPESGSLPPRPRGRSVSRPRPFAATSPTAYCPRFALTAAVRSTAPRSTLRPRRGSSTPRCSSP